MSNLLWEDNLLERKVESDLRDLLKTLVAFANSVKPGHIAVILIGERNDGTIDGVRNPDNIQKKVREEADRIYPPILWRSFVYGDEGKQCVRVEIEYNGDTPHFGGPSWIRKGSETVKASDEVFQLLIDIRTEIVMELSKWINKEVTVYGEPGTIPSPVQRLRFGSERIPDFLSHRYFSHRWPDVHTIAVLQFVNRFWATLQRTDTGERLSEPLQKLTLSFDDKRNQLKIIVAY